MSKLICVFLIALSCGLGSASLLPTNAVAQDLDPKDKLVVESVLRLQEFDIESSARAKAAILRYLRARPGSDQYFELIERFQPVEIVEDLAQFCLTHADETRGVRGAELIFAMKQESTLLDCLKDDDPEKAVSAIKLIGHAGGKNAVPILRPILSDTQASATLKTAAVVALSRQKTGQQAVLSLVMQGKLSDELKFTAANVLLSSDHQSIATEAAKHLQLPATANSQPLPTLVELVTRKGSADNGKVVFDTVGTCNQCHKVSGKGKVVGPDLSEIGSKLSREAMYVSILDPSAAISHNFETYVLLTVEGIQVSGLLISETDTEVTIRTSEGIDKTVSQDAVDGLKKQTQSLMPKDLQKLLTAEQLVDLVEYLITLRKP